MAPATEAHISPDMEASPPRHQQLVHAVADETERHAGAKPWTIRLVTDDAKGARESDGLPRIMRPRGDEDEAADARDDKASSHPPESGGRVDRVPRSWGQVGHVDLSLRVDRPTAFDEDQANDP